jgi:hypothetical protein
LSEPESVSSRSGLNAGISSACAPPASSSGAESRAKPLTLMTSRSPARIVVGVLKVCRAELRSMLRTSLSPLRAVMSGLSSGVVWARWLMTCGRRSALRSWSRTPITAAAINPPPDSPVRIVAASQRAETWRRSSMA